MTQEDSLYTASASAHMVEEEPTPLLRWRKGVLQQLWNIQEINTVRQGWREEWRDVPRNDED